MVKIHVSRGANKKTMKMLTLCPFPLKPYLLPKRQVFFGPVKSHNMTERKIPNCCNMWSNDLQQFQICVGFFFHFLFLLPQREARSLKSCKLAPFSEISS